jgi:hypothetical protein
MIYFDKVVDTTTDYTDGRFPALHRDGSLILVKPIVDKNEKFHKMFVQITDGNKEGDKGLFIFKDILVPYDGCLCKAAYGKFFINIYGEKGVYEYTGFPDGLRVCIDSVAAWNAEHERLLKLVEAYLSLNCDGKFSEVFAFKIRHIGSFKWIHAENGTCLPEFTFVVNNPTHVIIEYDWEGKIPLVHRGLHDLLSRYASYASIDDYNPDPSYYHMSRFVFPLALMGAK